MQSRIEQVMLVAVAVVVYENAGGTRNAYSRLHLAVYYESRRIILLLLE